MTPYYVMTKNGYRDINSITTSDYVLSHDGNFHKVQAIQNISTKMADFQCPLSFGSTKLPLNSCIFGAEFYRSRDKLHLDSLRFVSIQDIIAADLEYIEFKKHYVHARSQPHLYYAGTLSSNIEQYPKWFGTLRLNRRCGHYVMIPKRLDLSDPDLWYIMGCLMARGSCHKRNSGNHSVSFSVTIDTDTDSFLKRLSKFSSYRCALEPDDTDTHTDRYRFSIEDLELRELASYVLRDSGIHSSAFNCNKIILNLPKNLQQAILDGFMHYAGSIERDTHWVFSNINIADLLNMSQLILRTRNTSCSLCERQHKGNNRLIDYKLDFIYDIQRESSQIRIDNFCMKVIRNVQPCDTEQYKVLVVKDSHSYLLNNMLVGDATLIK